jgi:hypothetical protein
MDYIAEQESKQATHNWGDVRYIYDGLSIRLIKKAKYHICLDCHSYDSISSIEVCPKKPEIASSITA